MNAIGRPRWIPLLGVTALAIGAAATVAFGWTHARSTHQPPHSYLGATIAVLAARVPPPPGGPAVAAADRRAFVVTRALEGTWRWRQAERDADQSANSLLNSFSCAAGVALTTEQAPHLAALLASAGTDSARVAGRAKDSFKRPRPYTLYEGPTCLAPVNLGDQHDYPSGHTARGWTWGLLLAELIPNRRAELLARAKAYGESRVVCGFHSPTGIAGGRAVAALTVGSLMKDPAFDADLRGASRELAALNQRGTPPPVQQCRAEAALAQRPY